MLVASCVEKHTSETAVHTSVQIRHLCHNQAVRVIPATIESCVSRCVLVVKVAYVTVAGKYMKGVPLRGQGTWQQRIVGAGYQQVCGQADVWGDGVVPLPAAHLPGEHLVIAAFNLTELISAAPAEGRQLKSSFLIYSGECFDQLLGARAGALNLDLDGVYHSPLGSVDSMPTSTSGVPQAPMRPWYGSADVLDQWAERLSEPTGQLLQRIADTQHAA